MTRTRPAPASKPSPPTPTRHGWTDIAICALLLASTLALYSPVRHYDFVNYDDPEYVTRNAQVRAGLTAGGLAWALTSFDAANWFPATWLSHMADVQLFGLDGGWHHLTNVWLHALNALLLFVVLQRMTGARWPSAWVAFLFALHPLHVESVAWIAERKDVLCAFFWLLTVWCYARYAEKRGVLRYLWVALFLALALMAKPMAVTLPFVLLLLDVWPLKRAMGRALLLEKAPLVALAVGASLLTFLAQRQAGAVAPLASTTLAARIANAAVSYLVYIRDLFWPSGLAVLYPLAPAVTWAEFSAAAIVLIAISVIAARQFRTRPYLAVGWCWYVGTLVPVIGLVQVGSQSHADRYTYLPTIGLGIMLAWSAQQLAAAKPGARNAIVAAAIASCAACLPVAWSQIRYWESTETLDLHALEVTSGNFILRHNLADYYLQNGRFDDARRQEVDALRINPNYVEARLDLALALSLLRRYSESEAEYRKGLELKPEGKEMIVAHSGLGAVLASQHRTAEALPELELAANLRPDSAEGHYNLGTALAELRRNEEAAAEFTIAIRLEPDDPEAHHRLAVVLAGLGRPNDAAREFAAVAKLRPDDAVTQYNLALALERAGRIDEAIEHFSEALRLKPEFEDARRALDLATKQRGR